LTAAITVYIGIGSNLDNPRQQVAAAVAALEQLPQSQLVAVSPWYRSAPLGPGDQPDYINGVARIATTLPPEPLLTALQDIENRQGRRRDIRWGPRTLDLDILLYGDDTLASPRLTVPHPQLKQRNFVLVPLHDLAPALQLPDGTILAELLANTPAAGIVRVTDGD